MLTARSKAPGRAAGASMPSLYCNTSTVCSPTWSHYKQESVGDGCQETVMPCVDLGMDRSGKTKISTEISPCSTNLL